MNKKKLVALILLSALAVGSLSACGNRQQSGGGPSGTTGAREKKVLSEEDKQYIFKEEELTPAGEKLYDAGTLLYDGTYMYAIGATYNPDTELSDYRFLKIASDASKAEVLPVPEVEDGHYAEYGYYTTAVGEDGFFCLQSVYELNERPSGPSTGSGTAEEESAGTAEEESSGTEDADAEPVEAHADAESDEAHADTEPDEKRIADSTMEEEEMWFEPYDYSTRVYHLLHITSAGDVAFDMPLELGNEDGFDNGIEVLSCLEEGLLLSLGNHAMGMLSKEDGSVLRTIKEGEDVNSEDFEWYETYVTADSHAYAVQWGTDENGYEGRFAYEIDLENGRMSSEATPIPQDTYGYFASSKDTGSVYDMNNGNLYAFRFGDSEKTKIWDGIDSDMEGQYLTALVVMSDTEFYGLRFDDNGNNLFCRFTKVDPKDVKDKEVLTVGAISFPYAVRSNVIAFNKKSENCRIRIVDYSQYISDDADWENLTVQLNNDIISGNVPDILVMEYGSDLPLASYNAKELFEDLNPYIDNDADLNREDFLTNVLDAMSTNGKLYQFGPSINIMTEVAFKKDLQGIDGNWTIADCERIIEENTGDYSYAFGNMIKTDVLTRALKLCGDAFIDWDTQACSYNTDDFIRLLEFADKFPKEYDESRWEDYTEADYRNRKSLFTNQYCYTFDSYLELRYGLFGDEIVFAGFPYDGKKNYAAITMDYSFSMSATCPNKEEAWAFLRQFLLEEYQDTIEVAYPIRKSSLKKYAAKSMERPYYERPDGTRDYWDRTYWIEEEEIKLPNMTEEEVDLVMEMIESADYLSYEDDKVMEIIEEETAAFFSGQKSAKEVADIIQNRVRIYVGEVS